MRLLAMLVVLVGCDGPAASLLDAPTTSDAPTDGDGPVSLVGCPPPGAQSDLLACFDFEGQVTDATGNLTAIASNVTFVPGKLGMAASFDWMYSAIDIPDTPLLDLTAVTIEAWIRPTILPMSSGGRAMIWSTPRQYSLFVLTYGQIECQNTRTGAVTAGWQLWTHVACTIDSSGTQVFVDGVAAAQSTFGIGVEGTEGAGLGRAYDGYGYNGDIDLVRIYRRVRTPTEICADAGRADCP